MVIINKSLIIALGLAAVLIGVTAELIGVTVETYCDDNGFCAHSIPDTDGARRRAMRGEHPKSEHDGDCEVYYTQFEADALKINGGLGCCDNQNDGYFRTTAYRRFSVCYPSTEIETIEIGWDKCIQDTTYQAAIYQLDRSADITLTEMGDPIWNSDDLVCEDWNEEYPLYIDVDWDDSVESNYDDCRDIVVAITWLSGPWANDGNDGLCNWFGVNFADVSKGDVSATSYVSAPDCGIVDPVPMSVIGFDTYQFIIGFYACHGAYTPLECAVDDGVCGCDECKFGCQLERNQCTDDKKTCQGAFASCIQECDETHSDCKSRH